MNREKKQSIGIKLTNVTIFQVLRVSSLQMKDDEEFLMFTSTALVVEKIVETVVVLLVSFYKCCGKTVM